MTRDEAIEKAISARSDTATKLRMCGDENGDDLKGDEIMRRAYAALHASLAASGFAVVPVVATEEMAAAAVGPIFTQRFAAKRIYEAMLAAAQDDSHE